ncbi:MAG: dTDP-4-dehydrorhamnose 3,5-epimerase [Candidatus Eremiobacteraeota bacterium]|nr:dTDP-4-dehydrorhamnose 3,5-epimerase [Candidatus Eremiobacteraeota bacterium]MBV8433700.1 dTDP-4-dehydrorhamnose 3,5-epimerase [Candidatus Eremiobacteraeota bacterium]MBV8721686.1 dTDP-4-dehydrorhamnose 3,5-epimerase [Candidatus Eremiobacteraeota bacterium]
MFVPDVFEDDRGFFKETFSVRKYRDLGLTDEFVQDSVSFSRRNVLRGLHGDPQMSKLVQVLRGEIWDVIVDARRGSPAYGRWEAFALSETNHHQLYIPRGFLHGFLALTDGVLFNYKHSAYYEPSREIAVRWDDPTIGIAWPLDGTPIVSDRDGSAGRFADLR